MHYVCAIFKMTLHGKKKKKTGWKGSVKDFSIDYNAIITSNISDIHRYLIKNTWYKIIFGII